jgi:hypothetical protein
VLHALDLRSACGLSTLRSRQPGIGIRARKLEAFSKSRESC